jgi:hypothetical protein
MRTITRVAGTMFTAAALAVAIAPAAGAATAGSAHVARISSASDPGPNEWCTYHGDDYYQHCGDRLIWPDRHDRPRLPRRPHYKGTPVLLNPPTDQGGCDASSCGNTDLITQPHGGGHSDGNSGGGGHSGGGGGHSGGHGGK